MFEVFDEEDIAKLTQVREDSNETGHLNQARCGAPDRLTIRLPSRTWNRLDSFQVWVPTNPAAQNGGIWRRGAPQTQSASV